MKRTVLRSIALSLIALAVAAGTSTAVALPAGSTMPMPQTWSSAPLLPAPADDHNEEPLLQATATPPTSRTGTATINVSGVHPGWRLEAQAQPTTGGPMTPREYETGGPNDTAVVTLQAPEGGWQSRTRYGWFVLNSDQGTTVRGHFTTPVWDEEPAPTPTPGEPVVPSEPEPSTPAPSTPAPSTTKPSGGGLAKTGC